MLTLRGAVLSEDGTQRIADEITGPAHEAERAGQELARVLLERGAAALLARR
jgi:porphobilinogen deaminase